MQPTRKKPRAADAWAFRPHFRLLNYPLMSPLGGGFGGNMARAQHLQKNYAYRVLIATFIIVFMTMGIHSAWNVFFETITHDLGGDQRTISLVMPINLLFSALLLPFAGYLMDRRGAKRLFTTSLILYALSLWLISFATSMQYLLVVYGIVLATATAGASMGLASALVAQWFRRWRGLAVSITTSAMLWGQLVLVPVSGLLLYSFGWRLSHIGFGAAILFVTVAVTLLIPRHGVRADEEVNPPGSREALRGPLETRRWSEAFRNPPLWQLNVGFFLWGMADSLVNANFIPFATDQGFSATQAALIWGRQGLPSLLQGPLWIATPFGGFVTLLLQTFQLSLVGGFSDLMVRKTLLGLAYLIRAMAVIILLSSDLIPGVYFFVLLYGLVWMAPAILGTALISEIYGMNNLGTLVGISFLAFGLGGLSGYSLWAAILHLTSSFALVYAFSVLFLLGAATLGFLIPERRYSVRYITPGFSTSGD